MDRAHLTYLPSSPLSSTLVSPGSTEKYKRLSHGRAAVRRLPAVVRAGDQQRLHHELGAALGAQ
eukprot:1309046-Pyramimonas_sp.AAC.1